jgi:hypothetical protein
LLERAAEINQDRDEGFDISFTSMLLAVLASSDPLSIWFRRFVRQQGTLFDKLLQNFGVNREQLAAAARQTVSSGKTGAPLRLTSSARSLLEVSKRLQQAAGTTDPTDVRGLMAALIYEPGDHAQELEGLGIARKDLSDAFLDHISLRYWPELEYWRATHERVFQTKAPVFFQKGPSAFVATDRWTLNDTLGYQAYAHAIARFMTQERTVPPLTISIQAPWGGGKTSLMRMIQNELDPHALEDVKEEAQRPRGVLTVRQVLDEINRRIAGREDPPLPQSGFDLRLMSPVNDVNSIPTEGKSLIIVANVQDILHFRAFAADGKKVVDTDESQLLDKAPQIAELKSLLGGIRQNRAGRWKSKLSKSFLLGPLSNLWGVPELPQSDKERVISAVTSIVDHTPTVAGGHVRGCQRMTVWFNAWKYESANQVWSGLADAIMQQVAARLDLPKRERFWLELNIRRVDADRIRGRVYEQILRRWWQGGLLLALCLIVFALTMAAGFAFDLNLFGHPLRQNLADNLGLSAVISALTAGARFLWAKVRVEREPAALSLSDYLDIPDYKKELGFIHQVEADLRRVLASVPVSFRPLVVFIDDLDRCSPEKVAQVVEAVNLFLAGDLPDCMFVLGMDAEMVAAALQAAHKDLIACLPNDASIPVGWRFMDKFVQLPFLIPPAEDWTMSRFTTTLFSTGNGKPKPPSPVAPPAPSPSPPSRPVDDDDASVSRPNWEDVRKKLDEGIETFTDENPDIQDIAVKATAHFRGNPRDLKRFVNAFRFQYFLWWARRAQGLQSPSLDQLVRWTILLMRWPEVVRWLRRSGGTEWYAVPKASAGSAPKNTTRLKQIEEVAGKATDQKTWLQLASERLHLDPKATPWMNDDDLYEFFHEESTSIREGQRLSEGMGRGLW